MSDTSWLGKLQGSASEARQRAAEDAAQRKAEGQRQGSIILSQKDILTGQWDTHKLLFTTIGGQLRPITADDLSAFRRNIQTAQGRFKKGITAKQVIDFSLGADRKRATEEIRMAVPAMSSNGKVRFITNAGPDSDVTRHHVTVDFLNYGAEAASGLTDPRKSAMRLRKGPLAIECDCGRWRFWYRYIATIGGFNAGRAETGFPKIRNPKLSGIACKHILRVMAEVDNGAASLNFLTQLMDKAKSSDEAKAAVRLKQDAAEKTIKNQAQRTTGNNIKTSEQKRNERMAKAAANAAKQAKPMTRTPAATRRTETLNGLIAGYKANGITRKQLEFMDKSGMLKTPKGITKQQLFDAFGD
jgi:hypothetical protein